jgi:hypothetical protein
MRRSIFLRIDLFFVVIVAFVLQAASCWAAVIFVRSDGNDAQSGSTWAGAKRTVQAAIITANQGDELWIAAGTYPEHIKNKVVNETAVDVALYGGFAGNESAREQRNWSVNVTTLDGGGGPFPTPPESGSVITIDTGATQATRIDGFRIIRGHGMAGGGISISGAAPTITNNTIQNNTGSVGGGILISNYKITPPQSHAVVTNNTIVDNYAVEAGGGIAIVGSERIVSYDRASPIISQNNISRNISEFHGGGIGIYGHAGPQVFNNMILANTAAYAEENFMGNGGGIYATSRDVDDAPLQYTVCAPVITSNVIAANGANFGGGIHLWDTDTDHGGIPVLTNNTVVANNGTGITWITTNPVIQNNLVAFNARGFEQGDAQSPATAFRNNSVYGNQLWEENSNYAGLSDQTGTNGNISTDPLLANYQIGDFHLRIGSPCINAGYTPVIGSGWVDIDGQNRIIGDAVDIGADESDGTVGIVPTPVYHVSPTGNDGQNGSSWATAKRTVSAGIAAASETGGEVWVAAGTYVERNALPAFIYLYGGFAGDETSRSSRDIVAHPAILDGGSVPTVVNCLKAGYQVSTVDGFIIQNGGVYTGGQVPNGTQGYKGRGAGIYCQVASPLIRNNTIRHNSLGNPFDSANKTGYGAGVYTYLSYSLIENNTISENETINSISGQGGGCFFFRSMPTLRNNSITGNRAKFGAAVYSLYAYPRIIGNLIEGNSFYNNIPGYYMGAAEGAVTLDMNWDLLVERNLIRGNTAGASGGVGAGINAKTNLAGRIQNNLILSNIADGMGGGIYALAPLNATSSLFIVNNTIVANSGSSYGMEQGGGLALSIPPAITLPNPIANRVVVANNIIAFNSSGIFETLTTPMVPPTLIKNDVFNTANNYIYLTQGATDIHADPVFVDRTGGDFHLTSSSPCIDAGENAIGSLPATDYDGKVRILDGNGDGSTVIDMGAFEYGTSTPVFSPGDVNHDGAVDLADAVLTLQILTGIVPAQPVFKDADVNQNGKIGIEEAIFVLQHVAGIR